MNKWFEDILKEELDRTLLESKGFDSEEENTNDFIKPLTKEQKEVFVKSVINALKNEGIIISEDADLVDEIQNIEDKLGIEESGIKYPEWVEEMLEDESDPFAMEAEILDKWFTDDPSLEKAIFDGLKADDLIESLNSKLNEALNSLTQSDLKRLQEAINRKLNEGLNKK